MTITFEDEIGLEENYNLDFDIEKVIKSVVDQAAKQERCPYDIEITVSFTDNEGIREINREFRDLDAPTDVLSFPMVDYENAADFSHLEEEGAAIEYFNPDSGELMLGDIVISVERAKEQAEEYGHSLKREVAFLAAHSMLHLFGYDHMEPEECKVMEERQEQILKDLSISRED